EGVDAGARAADDVLRHDGVQAAVATEASRTGWRRGGEPMLVTASAGTRVDSLDHRPALDAYLEHLRVADGSQAALVGVMEGNAQSVLACGFQNQTLMVLSIA